MDAKEDDDSVTVRARTETWKKFRRIVFNSKEKSDDRFDSIPKIIDFMFNSLKDKHPLKELLG